MIVSHEDVKYQDPFLCLKVWEINRYNATTTIPMWHNHKELEFLLVLDGQRIVYLPEESWLIGPGDVVLVGSDQLHKYKNLTDNLRVLVLQFDPTAHFDSATAIYSKHFHSVLRPLNSLNYILQNNAEAKEDAAKALKAIHREINNRRKGYKIAVSLWIRSLFLTLVRNDVLDIMEFENDHKLEKLEQALAYVDNHLESLVNVTEASRAVNMSYHHFLRTFKKTVGMSFTEYVNFKRIKRAEQLLLTKPWSVEKISQSVGIPNRPHFYEMFKRYNGCTPSQFKKKMNGLGG